MRKTERDRKRSEEYLFLTWGLRITQIIHVKRFAHILHVGGFVWCPLKAGLGGWWKKNLKEWCTLCLGYIARSTIYHSVCYLGVVLLIVLILNFDAPFSLTWNRRDLVCPKQSRECVGFSLLQCLALAFFHWGINLQFLMGLLSPVLSSTRSNVFETCFLAEY